MSRVKIIARKTGSQSRGLKKYVADICEVGQNNSTDVGIIKSGAGNVVWAAKMFF